MLIHQSEQDRVQGVCVAAQYQRRSMCMEEIKEQRNDTWGNVQILPQKSLAGSVSGEVCLVREGSMCRARTKGQEIRVRQRKNRGYNGSAVKNNAKCVQGIDDGTRGVRACAMVMNYRKSILSARE